MAVLTRSCEVCHAEVSDMRLEKHMAWHRTLERMIGDAGRRYTPAPVYG